MESIGALGPPVITSATREPLSPETARGVAPTADANVSSTRHQERAPQRSPADGEIPLAEALDSIRRRYAPHDVVLRRDERIGEIVVEIRDPKSGRLVQQVPPEELINLRLQIREIAKATGLLVDSTT